MSISRYCRVAGLSVVALTAAVCACAQAAGEGVPTADDPAVLAAEEMPLAASSIVLDAVHTLSGYIAVGERGHILLSPNGVEWTQASQVPTRSTLNAVAAVGDDVWAAGHDGVILHSADAGTHWTRQRVDVWVPDREAVVGAPILDILFLDAQHGFAVGAYARFLETTDGGATWSERSLPPLETETAGSAADAEVQANPDSWTFSEEDLVLEPVADPHLNAIARSESGELMIAGERGAVFRSRDDGVTWERISVPYGGSMFGVFALAPSHFVFYGLRGKAFETRDMGDHWSEIDTGVSVGLMGGIATGGDGFVLVGAQGAVIVRSADTGAIDRRTFVNTANETPILAGLLTHPEGGYVVYGERGVDRYRPR